MIRIQQLIRKEQNLINLIATTRCITSKTSSSYCSNATKVMSFGDGSHGAIGLPTSLSGLGTHAYEPTIVFCLPSDVIRLCAGHYHSLALTSTCQLWSRGRNHKAQLERDILAPSLTLITLFI